MNATVIAIVIVLLIVIAVLAVLYIQRQRRSRALKERFGPEYDRTVEETGGRQKAEAELQQRQERRQSLQIRDLAPEARERYRQSWQDVQAEFVDAPSAAV